MTNADLQDRMFDALDALPPGVSVQWLAAYFAKQQDTFSLAQCVVVARCVMSQVNAPANEIMTIAESDRVAELINRIWARESA